MPFKFKAVPKKNPWNAAAPVKYYASPAYQGEVTICQLAAQIADIITVSSVDVLAVLEAFLQQIPKELIQGRIVKLRDFGTFRLTLGSEGADTESALAGAAITKLKPNFRPSKEFTDITKTITYEKA